MAPFLCQVALLQPAIRPAIRPIHIPLCFFIITVESTSTLRELPAAVAVPEEQDRLICLALDPCDPLHGVHLLE